MAYVIHENQLKDILNDAMAENPWVSKADIIKWLRDNRDIKIMASDKYWDTQSVQDYLGNKTEDEIDEIFWALEDEEWNPITTPEDTESSKPTKQEKIDYANKYNANEYSKIWNNSIKWFDETLPLMENAEKVADAYEKLWDKKNELTSLYNSWQSWDPEVYQAKLDQVNQALEDAENSEEFKWIVDAIRENWWASTEDSLLHPIVNATLEQMAVHYWSRMWHEKWASVTNTLVWDLANSSFNKFTGWKYSLSSLPEVYDMYNKGKDKDSTDWKKDSKWWSLPKDTKKFDEKVNNLTDAMKFWDDVSWAWWEDYLNARDDKLALALKLKWIESPEEIDKFLNKYDSWKWAKDEWKQNTLSRLADKMSKISDEDIKNKVKAAKENIKNKESKKDDNNIYDDKGNVIWKKHIEIKKKTWDNWTPSNDDSINWVEEDSSVVKDAIDIASWKKKLTKDDILWILPDKVRQLVEWVDKEAKTRLKNKETMLKNKDWVWKTDENWYRNPDSPINEVEEVNEKWGKGNVSEHEEQTPENNKYLHINETVKNLGSDKERIDYLKKHWFVVDKKTGFYTKNWMKTKVYKDWQYNPKWVKPDKKEWYNDRTLVEPSKKDDFQIALQKSWYKGPRDTNWNFLPITDEWLDLQEAKKKESKTKK